MDFIMIGLIALVLVFVYLVAVRHKSPKDAWAEMAGGAVAAIMAVLHFLHVGGAP